MHQHDDMVEELGVWDVQSQTITALDVGEQTDPAGSRRLPGALTQDQDGMHTSVFCLSAQWFYTITFFAVAASVITTAFIVVLWCRKSRKNSRK